MALWACLVCVRKRADRADRYILYIYIYILKYSAVLGERVISHCSPLCSMSVMCGWRLLLLFLLTILLLLLLLLFSLFFLSRSLNALCVCECVRVVCPLELACRSIIIIIFLLLLLLLYYITTKYIVPLLATLENYKHTLG